MRFILPILITLFMQGCVEKQSSISLPTSSIGASISEKELFQKSYAQLSSVAKSIHNEKEVIGEFENFIRVMKTYVNDYSSTIETSAYFSQALRVLPIPYAGEVSNATRIVSNSLVILNNTASSLGQYQKSSATFLYGFNQLTKTPNLKELSKLSSYADDTLTTDAIKLQGDMKEIAKTTKNLLYVNKLISDTSSTASGYFDRIKSFISSSPSEDEKAAIVKSEDNFEHKLNELNRHITILKNSATVNRKSIAKSRVISDLAVEVSRR